MEIIISQQCLCFFAATVLGFFLGMVYEVFRFLRAAVSHNAFFIGMEDFFFCLSCTFATILLCYAYADGVIRWFALAGILLGFYLYFCSLGHFISKLTKPLISLIGTALSWVQKRLLCPIWRLLTSLWHSGTRRAQTLRERRRTTLRIRTNDKNRKALMKSALKILQTKETKERKRI